jgi:hypothetical protein
MMHELNLHWTETRLTDSYLRASGGAQHIKTLLGHHFLSPVSEKNSVWKRPGTCARGRHTGRQFYGGGWDYSVCGNGLGACKIGNVNVNEDVTIVIAKDKLYHHDVTFTKRGWEFKATTNSGDTRIRLKIWSRVLVCDSWKSLRYHPILNATL